MRKEKENKKRRKLLPAMLAVALAAVMIVPMGSGLARAAEGDDKEPGTEAEYSLTVNLSSDQAEFVDDLKGTTLQFYQVASGEKNDSYDTYDWTLAAPFNTETIAASFETAQEQGDIDASSKAYESIAKEAVSIVAAPGSTASPAATGEFTKPAELDPGIYLVVPVLDTIEQDEEDNIIVTTDEWIYTFNPMMISVPTKDSAEDGSRGTAYEYGPWIKEVVMNAKVSREPALGSIAVQKTIPTYEDKDPGTFVFSIVATKGKNADGTDKVVYSDVVSITMDHPGTSDLRIIEKKIPVKSKVVVKEIYAGPMYNVAADPVEVEVATGEITEETTASIASFTNDYNGRHKGGGSIENRFTKGENSWNAPEQVYSKPAPSEE